MHRMVLLPVASILLVACGAAGSPTAEPPSGHPPVPATPRPVETAVMTLEQARQSAPFHLLEPAYLPTGFRFQAVSRWDNPLSVPPQTRFMLDYSGSSSSSFIKIGEEYWPQQQGPPGGIPPPPPYETPQTRVPVHGASAVLEVSGRYPTLTWAEGNAFVTMWGSLDVEELSKIAESMR